jgi:ABC-type Fe3+/spermidine/putrescine transport system ATPase subunit
MSLSVSLRDVHLRLGQFQLRGLSLEVPAQTYLCLLGPTGCGKTALLETVAGLQRPHAGAVLLDGLEVTHLAPETRGVGYVPQDHALFPHMTVAQNIAYGLIERHMPAAQTGAAVHGMAQRLRVDHLLRRRTTTLSGGERQRVALARALVLNCRLLLLDEPFSAVDQSTRRGLVADLRALHREYSLTVLHVTHDFTEACGLADQVAVLQDGAVLQTGSPADIFHRPACLDVARFVGLANVYTLDQLRSHAPELAALVAQTSASRVPGAWHAYLRADAFRLVPRDDALPSTVRGTVVDLAWSLAGYELMVDVGVPLRLALSGGERERLSLAPGDAVRLALVPGAAHLVPEPSGERA